MQKKNKEPWHYNAPFDPTTGKIKIDTSDDEKGYSDLTGEYLLEKMKKDPTLVAISSGTPTVLGFNAKRRAEAGKQFVDVGIAEEHAVALASGIAAMVESLYMEYTVHLFRELTTSFHRTYV